MASRPPLPTLTPKAAILTRSDQAGGEEVPFVSVDGCVPHLEVCVQAPQCDRHHNPMLYLTLSLTLTPTLII